MTFNNILCGADALNSCYIVFVSLHDGIVPCPQISDWFQALLPPVSLPVTHKTNKQTQQNKKQQNMEG